MSKRTRTISWIEGKIISELSKRQGNSSYLALSSCVLKNVRNIDEQHNLDIALNNLISRKDIIQSHNGEMTIYKSVA